MAKHKTKKERKPRVNKRAPDYKKPPRAIGVRRFKGQTYTEARRQVVEKFERAYATALHKECGLNISEAARRADIERAYVRALYRKAGLL